MYDVINCPGNWRDSQAAVPLIAKGHKSIGQFCLCVDQGFPRSGELEGIFVGPSFK